MKILSLNYEFPPLGGGAGYVTKAINKILVGKGIHVDLVTMHYNGLKETEIVDGVRVYRIKSLRKKLETCQTPEMLSFVFAAAFFVLKLTAFSGYDLVHSHFAIPTGIIAYLLKKKRNLKYIISVHGSDVPGYNPDRFTFEHRFTRSLLRLIMKNSSMVVPLSYYLKNLIECNISSGLPMRIITNGIEPDAFSVAADRKNMILMTGRLLPRKGFQYALLALEDVLLPGWEVHIAGDGPYRVRLEELAKKSRCKIIFHGWLDRGSQKLKRLYEESKIFILPSEVENAPISLLEGMNAGLAVITTNAAGCSEIAEDAALFVNPRDAGGIKKALLKLAGDEALIRKMGDRARARTRERFSWETITERYIDLYKEVIG
ncbi:MAG: glycosyltransferase family 4 protein [Candidatus Omnitrophica bacterium]|nr:glycosyltransferase family 4 protein [Candidatus Omnitrophota bacterium]